MLFALPFCPRRKALLKNEGAIETIAESLFELHKKQASDNKNLKLLIKQKNAEIKAANNLIKAIEQGIITEQTKARLQELEAEILRLDSEINKEKQKTYDYLPKEAIENYLRSVLTKDTENIQARKLIINTLIREILLYEDRIVITYNFTDNGEKPDLTINGIKETEKQSAWPMRTAFNLSSNTNENKNTKIPYPNTAAGYVLFFTNDYFGAAYVR